MSAAQIVLSLALAASSAYTVLGYPGHYGAPSGRSRLFRSVGLVLLDFLLGLLLLYTFLDFDFQTPLKIATLRRLTYILSCIFLGLSVLCVSLLDALETFVVFRREQQRVFQQALEEESRALSSRDNDAPKDGAA